MGCVLHEREGCAPCWLFLHGNGCDSSDWWDVWRHLPDSWRLVALDFRGHGDSLVPRVSVTFNDLADDVGCLLSQLSGRWHIAGHSLGGMVALRVAEQYPQYVAGLVLVEGWTNLRCAKQLANNFYGTLDDTQRAVIQRKSEATFARWPSGFWEDYWASVEAADATDFLLKADLPIIELHGDHGEPPLSRDKLGIPDRPNIQMRWVPDAGHYLSLEQPEFVAQACADMVDHSEMR